MNVELDQQISDSVDDEVDSSQVKFLLSRLTADRYLRRRWERYHLAGEVIRGGFPGFYAPDFTEQVMARVEQEPALGGVRQGVRITRRWTGAAVAASFMLVAVAGVWQWLDQESTVAPASLVQADAAGPDGVLADADNDRQRRIDAYVRGHEEFTAVYGRQGVVPYTRLSAGDRR